MSENKQKLNINQITKFVTLGLGMSWFELIGELWKLGRKLTRGLSNEGMYEVLSHESTLEIHDSKGKKATFKKRQKVRYLQDYIIAYHDQAWGDGEILIDYKCSPGFPSDQYQLGHKTIILISLREEKNKGDIDEFHIQWKMNDGFLTNTESWGTDIRHRTKKFKVLVIFPESRPPVCATIIESKRRKSYPLKEGAKIQLPDGRWQISWETSKPKLYENYILEWKW